MEETKIAIIPPGLHNFYLDKRSKTEFRKQHKIKEKHIVLSIGRLHKSKGLDKLIVNKETIENDLNNNWAVVAEAIQTILRRENYNNAYEELKKLTRTGEKITSENIKIFIDELNVSDTVKEELRNITPFNYTGI